MRKVKTILKILTNALFIVFLGGLLIMKLTPEFGGRIKGERLSRVKKSPHFKNGRFQNPVPTNMQSEDFSFWKTMREFQKKDKSRTPQKTVPVKEIDKTSFDKSNSGVKVNWLGHSTALIEIDGITILTDPVFSERTSPFSWAGTKRFDYDRHFNVEDLPKIDVVIISHDHYDHLDRNAVLDLKEQGVHFIMPLGVGAHFDRWGFSITDYTELDWWSSFMLSEKLTITATPARHFSGRGLSDRFNTLWASWVINNGNHSVFFSGDSGYFPGFKEIGDKYGPFDICLLECGQYGDGWPYIHMTPEETVQAFIDLKGQLLLPIHWGKYRLSLHSWIDPIERVVQAAEMQNCQITTPIIGEQIIVGEYIPQTKWWKEVENNFKG